MKNKYYSIQNTKKIVPMGRPRSGGPIGGRRRWRLCFLIIFILHRISIRSLIFLISLCTIPIYLYPLYLISLIWKDAEIVRDRCPQKGHLSGTLGSTDLDPKDLGPTDSRATSLGSEHVLIQLGPTALGPTDLGPTDMGPTDS